MPPLRATSKFQILYQVKHIKDPYANSWTATAPVTTRLQQDEFCALLKPEASAQASVEAGMRQVIHNSTPASEEGGSIKDQPVINRQSSLRL